MSETASSSKASLYKKMAGVMGRLERLPKRGHNQRFNYDYVLDEDVMEAVRAAMAEEGLAFFFQVVDESQVARATAGGKATWYTELTLEVTFADGETGASETRTWVGEALDSQDKGISKALTATVKYGLMKTFLISSGEESDADAGLQANGKELKAAKAAPHWIDHLDENGKPIRNRFWAWAKSTMALTEAEVYQALNVERIHDFKGTMKGAKGLIEAWVDAKGHISELEAGGTNDLPF